MPAEAELPPFLQPFVVSTQPCPRERIGSVDLYLPTGGQAAPAVLFVHGGPIPVQMKPTPRDWTTFIGYGQAAAAAGLVGATVDHRLWNPADYAPAAQDVAAAVELIRADARVDADRVALWFFSGAGLLCAPWLAEPPAWLRTIALSYPVLGDLPHLELDPGFRPVTAITHSGGLPIVLTRVGREDPGIDETVEKFVTAAAPAAQLQVIDVPNGRHGFDTIDPGEQSRQAVEHAIEAVRSHLAEG